MDFLELIGKNLLALYIGGSLRFVWLRYIRRDKTATYAKVLHGIPNPKTKQDDTFNLQNEMKNRHTANVRSLSIVQRGIGSQALALHYALAKALTSSHHHSLPLD